MARYWGDHPDWRAWKAQLYQESRLDPEAVSPAGAVGLAQFMPGTWADVAKRLGHPAMSRRDAKLSIHRGAYEMARLRAEWKAKRPAADRQKLAQASYNAGLGNILKAQKVCGMPSLYPDIIRCLGQVTGRYSLETITYVARIEEWRRKLWAR